jgi:hypothetical protein
MPNLDQDYWDDVDADDAGFGFDDHGEMPCGGCGQCTDCLANVHQNP